MIRSARFAALALAALFALDRAQAQCGAWETHFNAIGLNGTASAAVSFDDGSSPALVVGGSFTRAGDVAAARVARWDGTSWHALGAGLTLPVFALAVHDFGSGPRIVAASGPRVWVFDGAGWEALGWPGSFLTDVQALCVFDEGDGPVLFAGGNFSSFGGATMRHIARWSGGAWSAVGEGITGPENVVYDLCVFDDGTGDALYVGGRFSGTPSLESPDLLRWNGARWSAVGAGVDPDGDDHVRALAVHDDGSGARLILAGNFDVAGGTPAQRVASWDGASYAAHGSGLSASVEDLAVLPTGGGELLVACGNFSDAPATNMRGTALLSAGAWIGMDGGPGTTTNALAVHDDGAGARMVAVGTFINGHGNRVSEWDGAQWQPLPDGMGLLGAGHAFAAFDDGSGPRLFVGGSFSAVGNLPAVGLARWSGSAWSALPSPLGGSAFALQAWDDGDGPALFVGGAFLSAGGNPATRIARWDGASWSALGAGLGEASANPVEHVSALAVFDDGGGAALYAGGVFAQAGGVTAIGIARWNGGAWTDLDVGTNGPVFELLAFDDGNGPALFAAGDFTTAGGVAANRIARWDGSAWSAPGSGAPDGVVNALCAFDDGSGVALYAGGTFTSIGGVAAPRLARWDGAAWHALAHPFPSVHDLLVADLGSGPELVVATSSRAYRRAGATWVELGFFDAAPSALGAFDSELDGTPDLYVGGGFTTLVGSGPFASGIAIWRGCGTSATSYCAGDGSASACPCGNAGAPGHGCENSTLSGGARLSASGVPSVSSDSLRLSCDGLPPNTTTLFVQATGQSNGGLGSVLGDGLLCIAGSVLRIGSPIAQGDVASVGFGAQLPEALSLEGQIPLAGATRHYQVRYRNVASYCTSATFNQSNGASIVWAP